MNSEELELSLRTEFESYLKNTLADMRLEISQFQKKVEAEFEKHKSQLDGIFKDFSARIETDKEIDAGFKGVVVEHLRLARDEGASITATAFGEAEKMALESAPVAETGKPDASVSKLRAAISDISKQTSQAAILKSLVEHAAEFAPRGAFFIVKNEQFVGWRVFGKEAQSDDEAVRDVIFPVASSTVTGEAARSLSAVESSFGNYAGDTTFLDRLDFGKPDKMFAVPLVARGRGVAVLYADCGSKGGSVNVEALETLVCVAGLTVEVLAGVPSAAEAPQRTEYAPQAEKEVAPVETQKNLAEDKTSTDTYQADEKSENVEELEEYKLSPEETAAALAEPDYQTLPEGGDVSPKTDLGIQEPARDYLAEDSSIKEIDVEGLESSKAKQLEESDGPEARDESESYKPTEETDNLSKSGFEEYQFEKNQPTESEAVSSLDTSKSDYQVPSFDPTSDFSPVKAEKSENGKADAFVQAPVESVAESVPAKPVRSRLSDRNVDLPIEVSDDERRLHNDARRFARLLVSEIKLYNEQKVKEGREASDLYDRLREAIDRSREMYDKRVQPPVAAKFDYFHYELVNSLAEGAENKLGGGYPGAAV